MNVISKAKRIARKRINDSDNAMEEAKKRWAAEEVKESRDVQKVWKALEHINKSKDFKLTKSESNNFGEIATLEQYLSFGKGHRRELSYLGTVCIQTRSYKWRGSDESPEQDCSETSLVFKEVVNDNLPNIISVQIDGGLTKDAIEEFKVSLANYLSNHV